MAGRAGEMTVEHMMVTKRKRETMLVTSHFEVLGQFFGFLGSSGEDHVTLLVNVSF
jgi:hypothetical protein